MESYQLAITTLRCGAGCSETLVLVKHDQNGQPRFSLRCPMTHKPGGHRLVNLRPGDFLPEFIDRTRAAAVSQERYRERKVSDAESGHPAFREVRLREARVIESVRDLYAYAEQLYGEFLALTNKDDCKTYHPADPTATV